MSDTDGFFTHPLGRGTGGGQVADVITQPSGLYHLGGCHEDSAVIDTGAHVQYRRNANGLAHLCQSGPAVYLCRFRGQKTGLSAGDGVASGGEDDDIVLDQFLDNGDVPLIQRGTCVVSPYNSGYTSYAAINDVVVEGYI